MQRCHDMPFGAAVTERGVRFRLWAPAAGRIEVRLGRDERHLPLDHAGDGWFELVTAEAGTGEPYSFRIDGRSYVPDPASRCQAEDVHGNSVIIDPRRFEWDDGNWTGRPWEQTVLYELHTGAFTPEGTFDGVRRKLDYLADIGITAVELMPVADFPGARNWGYDGVLPFAPDRRYGTPDELKQLVQEAHARELMVFLDVVYNHFGPEGNYLHLYAPLFFTEHHHTPWGAAINYDDAGNHWVRQFVIHNAIYWLEEFHIDGLRLDAVHAIHDDSRPDILEDLADAVRAGPGRTRHVHLVLENDNNIAQYMRGDSHARYRAQWNDDIHHALHVVTTGEENGYYADYATEPTRHLGRCLAEGFAYQGEVSPHRQGRRRGESSADLPPTAFVSFLQNHDQVGNRAFGERITELAPDEAVRAAMAILLLAPSPPLLFMGQEWGAGQRFPFFCDFGTDLAQAVTEGRRREFADFPEFRDPDMRKRIPDPMAPETFASAVLGWSHPAGGREHHWIEWHRRLLRRRHDEITPRLNGIEGGQAHYELLGPKALTVDWGLADGTRLILLANLNDDSTAFPPVTDARLIHAEPEQRLALDGLGRVGPWSVVWLLQEGT